MYAFTTHASDVWEKPRLLRIDGNATFTTVVSTTIIRSPTQRITRASQRVRVLRLAVTVFLSVGSVLPTAPVAESHRSRFATRGMVPDASRKGVGHHAGVACAYAESASSGSASTVSRCSCESVGSHSSQ